MPILICAASSSEAAACRRGVSEAGLAHEFEILRTGLGLQRAGRNLEFRLKHEPRPSLIVSSGFAGAFSASIPLHGWITAQKIYLFKERFAEPCLAQAFVGAQNTALVSATDLLIDHAARADVYAGLDAPVSVDMESAALAALAAREKIPCMVLRMITDTPQYPLPGFLFAFVEAGGTGSLVHRAGRAIGGMREAISNPRAVARLVREGTGWGKLLEKGWAERAAAVVQASNNSFKI